MNSKTTKFEDVEVLWKRTKPFLKEGDPAAHYTGYHPHTEVLTKGYQKRPDRRPLPCDILFEQDLDVQLRDGVTIRVDVYRPTGEEKYPAIISWSPYGKNGSGFESSLDIEGVDMTTLSGLQKFEGADPAYWCNEGYVMVHPDSRGSYMSEGDVHFWGTQDGRDAYDVVEWIAQQPWSNGKVAFAGNSWLAVAQWFAAAEQPPHLAAIAPWEGHADLFGDDMCRGGIPNPAFNSLVVAQTPGQGYIEDTPSMVLKYPYRNAFWQDKRPDFSKITVPAYIAASYNSPVHTRGTFEGFRKIASEHKWLRIHNTGEWPDFYAYQDDLKKFFDCFLKGIDNGWMDTPKVRMSVIDPGGRDIINRVEEEWPLTRQQFRKLYLSAENKLSESADAEVTEYRYDGSNANSELVFTYTVPEDFEYVGYGKLRLWVGAELSDDMDINVTIDKLSADGTPLVQDGLGRYIGPAGKLRASRRKLNEELSTENEPVLMLDEEMQLLSPGEIVCVDVPIWPTGMRFHKGEQLRITIKPDSPSMLPPPTEGSFEAAPDMRRSAGTAEEAFAMANAPMGGSGMPPGGMPPMGGPGMPPDGMPPMGGPGTPPGMGGGLVPNPPRPGGIHKYYVGGQYEAYFYFPTVEPNEGDIVMRKMETDIVVISAGTAGLAAAATAAELGLSVIAVEKNGSAGGNGNMANGPFAVESRLQRERMYELTAEEAYKIHMQFTRYEVNGALVKHYIDRSAGTIDWLESIGVEFEGLARHGHGMKDTWHLVKPLPGTEDKPLNGGYIIVKRMKERAESLGAKVLLKTEVTQLIKEGGKVVGVMARDAEGELEIRAKAVISAAGGYGAHWRKPMGIPLYGDGLRMAREVGADVTDGTLPIPTKEDIKMGPFNPFMLPFINSMGTQPNLMVNRLGERFVDEEAFLVDPHGCLAINDQPGRDAWMIFNDDIVDYYMKHSFDFIEGYGIRKMKIQDKPAGFAEDVEKAKGLPFPVIFSGDSVEELAAQVGLPADALKETWENYNRYCETGRDADFGKRAKYLRPIKGGKYYAVRAKMILGVGYAEGISVNNKLQAVNAEKKVIPGLYAAGMDCARSIWGDVYVNILPGNALGWAINSGRMAAEYAAEQIKAL